VTVLDGADKPVSGATNPITLTISGGPTGAALQCAANPANAQAGSALFSACAINTAGTYTLTASSGSLLAAVQSGFLVSPTAAVKLGAVSTSFGPAAAPTTFTVKATAQTTAGAAFPVGTATNVRLVLKTGSGTLGGTLTAAMPPGASTVTFPAVTYSVAESGVLLTVEAFAGATLVPADSEPFTVTAQPQVLLRFDPNPVAVGLGAGSADVRIVLETGAQPVDGVQVTVSFDPAKLRVEDADPNADGVQLIPGAALSQMLLSNVDNVAGMVRFAASRTVGQPAPSGSITVATIKLSGRAAGTWPLTFTPGGSEVGSETLNLGVGLLNGAVQVTPRRLAFVAQPVRGAGGVAFGFQPVVAVQDAAGQTIVTDNATVVTLALAADGGPAGAQLQCAQMTRQAAAGVAMFEGCSINLPGGGYMLEATADGMDAGRAAPLSITLPGDVDGDCRVNVMDFSTVVSSYGQSPGAVGWPATEGGAYRADINGDGRVGVVDFSTLVNKYGGSVAQCAPPSDLPTVAITGAAFRTPALTVSVGSTIVWLNRDIAAHTITGDTGGWASRSLAPGASFSRRFDTPGTYAYHSAQNPAMQGTITVQ
ncbi:MAG: dockerin type I domain-containing protein, partial [Chloroflexi bacterium]|nr:dockerin type I domain-containing protein [Chloroflexota bacterium]